MTKHSFEDVLFWAKPAIEDEDLRKIALEAPSPNAAHDRVMAEYGDEAKAKATRWLAIIKRDFSERLDEALRS